jgi:hypothetical protein
MCSPNLKNVQSKNEHIPPLVDWNDFNNWETMFIEAVWMTDEQNLLKIIGILYCTRLPVTSKVMILITYLFW